jgi:hypothetical protein
MRKIFIVITVTIAGLYTLKAQYPDVVLDSKWGFELNTSLSSFQIITKEEADNTYCMKYKSLWYIEVKNDGISFDKPIYTSQIGSLCDQDFYLYASGRNAMRIATNGFIYIPFSRSFTFGNDFGEGNNRLRIMHSGTHAYIDYKDNLHFRADKNWISALTLYGNGSVGVGFGTTYEEGKYMNMGYKLAVNGGIICEEVKVIGDVPDADYVFEDNYSLTPLSKVEDFIKENKHLPNIPSADEFKTNGYKIGEMDEMLLRKIEELTLYIIEQNKKIEDLQKQLQELKPERR